MKIRKLYLFDFDGTISSKDSFWHFLITTFGLGKVIFKLGLNFHKLLLCAISNKKLSSTKELILSILLKGKKNEEIRMYGNTYVSKHMQDILREEAIKKIESLKKQKENSIWIVSASLDIWLKPFSEKYNVNLLCTEADYMDDVFTGKFKTPNCKGIEKLHRIKANIAIDDYDEIISFGDSKGDKEMFQMSTQINYKPFR
ncbi:MAG: HAD-IB family hydrolase [Flavobacteriaceae bacterium]|nr:HAD-IB family hydrolase [Flavobacteriaceae bacterium]